MTPNNPREVILVPGADSLTFETDRAEAVRRGIPTRELTLPPFTGHPIDDRQAHFDTVADMIEATLREIRASNPAARVAAIGRNNGGGQLAWAAARNLLLDGIVLVGAIPEISRYRRESKAPSAVKFRDSLKNSEELDRIVSMKVMDIIATSQYIAADRCLIQFGSQDPYIDETATDAAETLAKRFQVTWLNDDHAMESKVTLAQRWDFIEQRFQGHG